MSGRWRVGSGLTSSRTVRGNDWLPGAAVWSSLLGLVVALIALPASAQAALWIVGVTAIVFGVAVFLDHGGSVVTGAGVYCLAAGAFIGGGAVYYARNVPERVSQVSIFWAATWAIATTLSMYAIFWWKARRPNQDVHIRPVTSVPPWALTVGIVLVGLGIVGRERNVALGTLPDAAAFDGALIIAVSVLLRRSRLSIVRLGAAGVAFAAYFFGSFSGGGRLLLVSLALAIVMSVQMFIYLPWVKRGVILLIVPALALFAAIGRNRVVVDARADVAAGGLASAVNPLNTFAEMLDMSLDGGGVRVFLAPAVVVIPREVWPGKPLGFGRAAAVDLYPATASRSSNFTVAALNQGEWYYGAGFIGIILMVPITGFTVLWIDRRLLSSARRRVPPAGYYMTYLGLTLLASGFADLAWVGPYTWGGRVLIRVVVILPFIVLERLAHRKVVVRHRNHVSREVWSTLSPQIAINRRTML